MSPGGNSSGGKSGQPRPSQPRQNKYGENPTLCCSLSRRFYHARWITRLVENSCGGQSGQQGQPRHSQPRIRDGENSILCCNPLYRSDHTRRNSRAAENEVIQFNRATVSRGGIKLGTNPHCPAITHGA